MNTLLAELPSWSSVLLVPVIMLISAVSVAVFVVGIRLLIRFVIKAVGTVINKGDTK